MRDKSGASTELHIIVPGICGPLAETQSLQSSEVIDRWVNKLAKSSSLKLPGNANEVLASILNINLESDFPSAALTLLANEKFNPAMFYMHADPVHLRADLDSAVLTSSTDLNIGNDESVALCQMLDQHFKQDDLSFFLLNTNQWFVASKDNIKLRTTPLVDATGRNINFILPTGEGSSHWKRVLTEAQMLMHSHQINSSREQQGYLTINSLWFHGAGELIDIKNAEVTSLCSNHDMLKGIAGQLKCDYLKVPETVKDYADILLNYKQGAVNVLHLSELEHLVNYTDVRPWMKQLTELLDGWIYPILNLANKNNINVTLYPCIGKKYQFSKYDTLKFWRKGKLEEHVSNY